ncbi:MAG: hypothetical protein JW917_05640 [Ignavibacteria bacterium]|nr:hypothetical protein [Ignavibacteria bacterium]
MKKIILILVFLITFGVFSGCDMLNNIWSYNVTIVNDDYDKYISAVYVREYYQSGEIWSKNNLYDYIYPGDAYTFSLYEGTYDFWFILEDDYYVYSYCEYDVPVDRDFTMFVYIDGIKDEQKADIIKTPKENIDK